MLELYLFICLLFIMCIFNMLLSTNKASSICYENLYNENFNIDDIGCVFDYHTSFSIKNWFGYKHWFYPYKI